MSETKEILDELARLADRLQYYEEPVTLDDLNELREAIAHLESDHSDCFSADDIDFREAELRDEISELRARIRELEGSARFDGLTAIERRSMICLAPRATCHKFLAPGPCTLFITHNLLLQ